jgi:hypothetical protein
MDSLEKRMDEMGIIDKDKCRQLITEMRLNYEDCIYKYLFNTFDYEGSEEKKREIITEMFLEIVNELKEL